MRIIITQNEIEVAVRNYIQSQIAIQPGQDIVIDFKATRGDSGLTAEIDITPAGQVQSPRVENTTAPVVTEQKADTKVIFKKAAAPAKAEPEVETENPEQTTTAPVAADTDTHTSADEDSAQDATQSTDNVEIGEDIQRTVPFDADEPVDGGDDTPPTKEAPASNSLFKNLKRPVNS